MKRITKIILLPLAIAVLLLSLCSCNNDNQEIYTLTEISIVSQTDYEEIKRLDTNEFEEQYYQIQSDLGKTITIKNQNEITFSGSKTAEYNGKAKLYDAGLITYVTIDNADFYSSYDNISILQNNLYIESHFVEIEGSYLKFTFKFEKSS